MDLLNERDARKQEVLTLTRGPALISVLLCVGSLVLSHLFQVLVIAFALIVVGSAIGLITKPDRYPRLHSYVFQKSRIGRGMSGNRMR
jgi:hypothetical protein